MNKCYVCFGWWASFVCFFVNICVYNAYGCGKNLVVFNDTATLLVVNELL